MYVVSHPLQETLDDRGLVRNSIGDGRGLVEKSVSVSRVEFVVYLSGTPLGQRVQTKERGDGDDVIQAQAGGAVQLAGVDVVDELDESLAGDKVEIDGGETLQVVTISHSRTDASCLTWL